MFYSCLFLGHTQFWSDRPYSLASKEQPVLHDLFEWIYLTRFLSLSYDQRNTIVVFHFSNPYFLVSVTTCRKAVTIVMSFLFFTKPFTHQ